MIIFLYGPDSYRANQKLQEIVSHYKGSGKSGLNLRQVDATEVAFEDFYRDLKTSGMFAEKKLVVIKQVFDDKKFQEELVENLKDINGISDVVVIFEVGEVDQRTKLFKSLKKETKAQEFALLDTRQIKAWAQKELEKIGSKSNLDALDVLVSYVGNDLWRLAGELKKLAAFRKDGPIKKADVEALVRQNIESDIFKTVDALAARNKPQALALIHKHLDGGEAPIYLVSMIAWGFKNLLMIKELAEKGLMYDSIVKKSGLHPFVVKKNYFACRQFSLQELKAIYRYIFKMDTDMKTGGADPETALDMFIAKI